MSDYLVEVYTPRSPATFAGPGPADVSGAAEELTREGRPVQFVRSILVPEDETCFYFFESQTSEAVSEVATRAGLRFERVLRAFSDWQAPAPAEGGLSDPSDTTTGTTDKGEQP